MRVAYLLCIAALAFRGMAFGDGVMELDVRQDRVTRYVHITYQVPADAPDEVNVICSWSPVGKDDWRPARVTPLISETGLRFATSADWDAWMQGRVLERRAAGLGRTVVFNPYPETVENGRVDVDFRTEIRSPDGKAISTSTHRVQTDDSDVLYINDWSKVLQKEAIGREMADSSAAASAKADGQWSMGNGGTGLRGKGGSPLPQLTYPLDLHGWYAVFVCTEPGKGRIGLRLTGDERTDKLSSPHPYEEVLWRWCRMNRQHLVLKQLHTYAGWSDAQISYVKFVPLSENDVSKLEAPFAGKHDKTVIGYFEPYSWAFNEDVQSTLQHREPLTAFAEAGVDIVDTQAGRFGAKAVYESRKTDQLLYGTRGDPINGVVPETGNVGRMQQYTNTLESELRYTRELGITSYANFGATNCYIGSPLQGDISKQHPEWVKGHVLRYDIPEARAYMLSIYREMLEIGAPGISIDFCRYPEGIDKPETCTGFLRGLRRLADEFGGARKEHVPILIRFPAKGVRLWENFDFRTWIHEGLVDYLCPSNIQGRHHHFDLKPYAEAVRGTRCKLTPVVDGISWGPRMPGPYLWRVRQLYDAGADGVYIYQADCRVLGWPSDRRCVRILGSAEAVRRWWACDEAERPTCSKGIYITSAMDRGVYKRHERLRVWLEGIEMGALEMYLDGKLVSRYDGPPYLLGTEEYESDTVIPPGEHKLTIRAKDGNGWLEQTFTVEGAS